MYINTNMYFYISSPVNIYKADRLYPGKHLMMKFWTSLQDINHLLIIYIIIKVQRSSVQKLSAIIYIFHIILHIKVSIKFMIRTKNQIKMVLFS